MAYRKTSAGYELESVPFSAGRIYATSNINGTTYDVNYHLTDQVGSVRAVVNSGGEVQQQSDYYAFGLRHASTDFATNDNRYQLTGKESQKDFGFNYLDFHARQYDPTGIQFTSQDPLQDKYTSIGSYNYCGGNPILFIDPDGRERKQLKLSAEVSFSVGFQISLGINVLGVEIKLQGRAFTTELSNTASLIYNPDNSLEVANDLEHKQISYGYSMATPFGGTETELSNDTSNKSEQIRTDTKKEGFLETTETTTNIGETETEENFSFTLVSGEISLIGGVSYEVKIHEEQNNINDEK